MPCVWHIEMTALKSNELRFFQVEIVLGFTFKSSANWMSVFAFKEIFSFLKTILVSTGFSLFIFCNKISAYKIGGNQ